MILFYYGLFINYSGIITNFNFIMILFYSISPPCTFSVIFWFQFHYDLILLLPSGSMYPFLALISISLWSYSIIVCISLVGWVDFNFNFIMILFYCIITNNKLFNIIGFQFHYDLILFTRCNFMLYNR